MNTLSKPSGQLGRYILALAALIAATACGFTNNNIHHPRHHSQSDHCDCSCR